MKTTLALVAAIAATLLPIPAQAGAAGCAAKARGHFVGLGGGDSLNNVRQRNCILGAQAKAGAGVLRQGLDWSFVEKRKGHFSFHTYDGWVLAAAKHHQRVLAILSNPPRFRERKGGTNIGPPKSNRAFARYAAAAVRRYGPKGSLWRGKRRKYRRYAIHSWQVWNEPNLPQYWAGKPNAKQYVKLLKAGYRAIRKADRHAEVVTAGLPESLFKGSIQATRFVPAMYRASARRWFNTLAVNPYAPSGRGVLALVRRFRSIMNHHHDRSGKLWVTEVGWGTAGPKHRYNIGATGQARQLKALLKGAYRARKRLKLRGLIYFGWKDKPPYPPTYTDMWGLHTGLETLAGVAKPAFAIFASLAPRLK